MDILDPPWVQANFQDPFCMWRQTRDQTMDLGPMCLSPWAQEEASAQEEENDDSVCCQLCVHHL